MTSKLRAFELTVPTGNFVPPRPKSHAILAFSDHTGANWLWGDGSARFMIYAADEILPQLCTRNGGEAPNIEY